jgi:ferric-dicitrate binding protein FerR (iron transport regulator)
MTDLDLLIHRHLEGTLSPGEAVALRERLRTDAAARRRLAEMAFDHVQLKELLAPAPLVVPESPEEPAEPPARALPPWSKWHFAAAASILVAVTIALVVGFTRTAPPGPEESPAAAPGRREMKVATGQRIEAPGREPAACLLEDGSRAELAPASAAVFRGRTGDARQVVELERGKGRFRVAQGKGAFRVETESGKVTALGTDFTVELRPQDRRGREGAPPPALAVSVAEGAVRVEFRRKSYDLRAPESRVFGEPDPVKPSPDSEKRPFRGIVRGKVVRKTEALVQLRVEEPAGMRDRVITVRPGRTVSDDREEVPNRIHVSFLRKLKDGEPLSIELREAGDEEYEVAGLTQDQVDWAQPPKREEKKGDEPRRPVRPKDPGERGEGGKKDEGDK